RMAQSYIDMARLAAPPQTDSPQSTLRDFVLQHNTILFAPDGMCSRILDLEHQILALTTRITALENAQSSGRPEPDERFRTYEVSTPTTFFPFNVTGGNEPAAQETVGPSSTEPVRPLKRARRHNSVSGSKSGLQVLPVIQVAFNETAQSLQTTQSFLPTPDPGARPSGPPRKRSPNKASAGSKVKNPRKRRRINPRSANSKSEEPKLEVGIPDSTELICCDR
ncbi:hypothetical protein FRC01_013817, partial [Tulasnella sp. 417]